MYKMKTLLVSFILILPLLAGCSDDDRGKRTLADLDVVIKSGETYKYVVTTGLEEQAAIVQHPASEYLVSEYKKDSVTTNGIYTYTPGTGFIGVDEVVIEKQYYTFDSEPQLNKAYIKLKITVEKDFPDLLPAKE